MRGTTQCLMHAHNSHEKFSRDEVAGMCHDTGISPSVSPTTPPPSQSPVTSPPTIFQLDNANIINTEVADAPGKGQDYFIILTIILMILLTIIGFVLYCLYKRNCVEKQLDRISGEFMKRDPKRRRLEKEEPKSEQEYRKREIEAQAASFREYLDEQISDIKDQLQTAKHKTAESSDRFEKIKMQISERFVSLLEDTGDDSEELDRKRQSDAKRKRRKSRKKSSKPSHTVTLKRTATNRERKIINILPAESEMSEDTTIPSFRTRNSVLVNAEMELPRTGGAEFDMQQKPSKEKPSKLHIKSLHVRQNANTQDDLNMQDELSNTILYNQVQESHSSDDLDVITPVAPMSPICEFPQPKFEAFPPGTDFDPENFNEDYLKMIHLME